MEYNIAYFKSLFDHKDIYELPEAVKVHLLSSSSGSEYDFAVKFIWKNGVGFSESDGGCSWIPSTCHNGNEGCLKEKIQI